VGNIDRFPDFAVVLGMLIGRYIKLGNPSAEQPTVWRKKARDRIGRLARFFTDS
jgi:hypothetical protein